MFVIHIIFNYLILPPSIFIQMVILVASAYHMKRSLYIFRKTGIDCIPAQTDYKIDSRDYNLTSFLPKTYEMDSIFKGLKDDGGRA